MPKYRVNQRRIAISRSYDVGTEAGEPVFRVAGKLRFARTFDVDLFNGEGFLRFPGDGGTGFHGGAPWVVVDEAA